MQPLTFFNLVYPSTVDLPPCRPSTQRYNTTLAISFNQLFSISPVDYNNTAENLERKNDRAQEENSRSIY